MSDDRGFGLDDLMAFAGGFAVGYGLTSRSMGRKDQGDCCGGTAASLLILLLGVAVLL